MDQFYILTARHVLINEDENCAYKIDFIKGTGPFMNNITRQTNTYDDYYLHSKYDIGLLKVN